MSSHPEVPDEGEGGSGGESAPNLRETRLQEKAIRERWPIPVDVRIKILRRLVKIVDDDAWDDDPWLKPNNREVIAASRALLSADKLNLDREKFDLEREQAEGGGSYADIPDDEPDVEPRVGPPEEGMPG